LSRETPRHSLEFLAKAFGCKRVGWDATLGEGAYCNQNDSRITHQIVDRPDLPVPAPSTGDAEDEADAAAARKANERVPGRIYVQPQWVWDSINAGQLQRPDFYAPGATLPPHLSPWVKPKKGAYDPTIPLADQETAAEAEAAAIAEEEGADSELEDASEGEEVPGVRGDDEAEALEALLDQKNDVAQGEGMDVELAASSSSDSENEDGQDPYKDAFSGFSDADDEPVLTPAETAARAHQAELEAEARGLALPSTKAPTKKTRTAAVRAKETSEKKAADEDVERRKMMMSRRKRKMFEKMVYSNARKDEESELLREKRRKIEKGAKA
jgi:pescadillo protein